MKRYAFVIGRNGPVEAKLNTLQFAESDAKQMQLILEGVVAGFNSVVLPPLERDAASCLRDFEDMASSCGYDDMLVFYFSGHGHNPRGDLFLLFPVSSMNKLVTTAIPITSVKAIMAQSRARVRLLILDCCHSGAAAPETLKNGSKPQELALVEAARDSATIIIAACGRNVVTREQTEFGGGYLTYLLKNALSNLSVESDMDRDGLISVTDFIEWASTVTEKINKANAKMQKPTLEPPEVYGDFRSQVFLTASRFVVRDDELNQQILNQVEKIRQTFAGHKWVDPETLQKLARPIKSLAPTFTSLTILDELFRKRDNAAIFAAATILQIRRDPRYMSILVSYVNDPNLRGAANWRVLRAIRDTISRYEFSETGRIDFIQRLREVADQRDTKRGKRFARGTSLSMLLQITKRLKISPKDVLKPDQLKGLKP